jgi:outer membrane biosynthesis protein TonB
VRLLSAPTKPSGATDGESQTITPAYASSDNALPLYPADALRAGCTDGVVPLRVYVGADGSVMAQRDIPGRPVAADSCSVAFLAAVESAVARWKFAPAFRVTQVPTSAPGVPAWHQTPIAIYLDFEFRFEVVDGRGVVRAR